jgi:hypothetical protein
VDPKSAYDFTIDSEDGDHTEFMMLYLLLITGFTARLRRRKWDNRKDIVVTAPIEFTIEVKGDHVAVKTGNVGIEISSYGRDSGIIVTTADYWLHVIAERDFEFGEVKIRILFFKTDELKRCIGELSCRDLPPGEGGGGPNNDISKMGWIKGGCGDFGSDTHLWITKTKWASEYAEFDGSPEKFLEYLEHDLKPLEIIY